MLLGIDIGTGSAKAVLIDLQGVTVAEAGAAYAVDAPQPGWGEADPKLWWQAVVKIVRELPLAARAEVKAIGLSGQMHGMVLTDDRGEPLRPAILWLDNRAVAMLERYPVGIEERVGNPLSAGMGGPILLWLRDHEPDQFRRARWALQAKDWLRLKLTGVAATEPSDASANLLTDTDGQWDDALLAALEIPRALLPPVLGSAAASGMLTPAAAHALGLPAAIPVAGGAADAAAAAFGSGLYRDGAAQITTGSGAQIVVIQRARPRYSSRLNAYRAASAGDLPRWYVMAAMQNAGVALEWARGLLGLDWSEAYERAFAPHVAPSGVMFLPYLTGERTPLMDPSARGAWVGLTRSDDAGSLMHAAFLGVAFTLRAGLDALREQGIMVERLRLAGGGSVHPAWRRMLIDVLGVPLDAVVCPNASARGAALLGGLAAGVLSVADLIPLAPALTPLGDPSGDVYHAAYQRFNNLYQRLAGWFADLAVQRRFG